MNILLPYCLRAGAHVVNYWYLTIREIKLILQNYADIEETRAKENIATSYNVAQLTAAFVGSMLSGKPIPSIEDVFPSFNSNLQETKVEIGVTSQDEKEAIIMKEKMLEFARIHNEKRRKALENVDRRIKDNN